MTAVLITLLCLAVAALLLRWSVSRLATATAIAAAADPTRALEAAHELEVAGAAVRDTIDHHREARNRVVTGDR